MQQMYHPTDLAAMDPLVLMKNLDHVRITSRRLSYILQQQVHLYVPEANQLREQIDRYVEAERQIRKDRGFDALASTEDDVAGDVRLVAIAAARELQHLDRSLILLQQPAFADAVLHEPPNPLIGRTDTWKRRQDFDDEVRSTSYTILHDRGAFIRNEEEIRLHD